VSSVLLFASKTGLQDGSTAGNANDRAPAVTALFAFGMGDAARFAGPIINNAAAIAAQTRFSLIM
jgi:hypothetical protein